MNRTMSSRVKHVIQILDSLINWMLLSLFIIMTALGCYALWDSEQIYQKATESYTQYRPDNQENQSFNTLVQLNPDVIGWLRIKDTHIDHPLLQGKDNHKYVNTSAKGDFAISGAIFLDYRNARDFSDFNSIIFGHHMDKNAMFGNLTNFNDLSYFESHLTGSLHYNGIDHGLEIFGFLHADAYDALLYTPGISPESERYTYLDHLKSLAIHWREPNLQDSNHIVLLSTCTNASTNGREILVARITDPIFNPSETTPTESVPTSHEWLKKIKIFLSHFNALPFIIPILMILPGFILKLKRK